MPEVDVVSPGGDEMADQVAEQGNMVAALTAMANGVGTADAVLSREFAASAGRRVSRFDQLGADAAGMWSIAMTTPTVNAGLGFRTATESGSGRTRLEANRPAETGAAAKE